MNRRAPGLALVPAALFAVLAAILWRGLSGDPSTVPSVLVGKPVPEFALPPLAGLGVPGLASADLRQGKVTLVNIWASWCGPCRQEHPLLMQLAQRDDIRLVGINHKDDPGNARRFLGGLGQPFAAVGTDANGRTSIDFGSYGVPETFVVDGRGIIRYKWIGPLSQEAVAGPLNGQIEAAKTP